MLVGVNVELPDGAFSPTGDDQVPVKPEHEMPMLTAFAPDQLKVDCPPIVIDVGLQLALGTPGAATTSKVCELLMVLP